ncbi:DALR anticodon-binding domain-containing protein [Spirillospora sp. NPDC048911]|uniref:DALR anticodon-binding domain-containing protein n=1 Tax=Spirillospora sp. NPDC048911 TaxID=3364527 RepID=UPI003719B675
MTPADVSSAIARAVGVRDVPLSCLGPGTYGSPVALRLGLDVEGVAERVRTEPGILGVETSGGFLTVSVGVAETVQGVLRAGDAYGVAEVPHGGWHDRPRTFENPGFRVRYAYARACSVGRRARDLGVSRGAAEGLGAEELLVVGVLGDLPGRASQAGREGHASALVKCLERLADAFHGAYERCPALPKGDEKPGAVHGARVTLAEAARIALGNGLKMIGETPRERI